MEFTDDVYTTIPDPNNPIYTSESETYARIPPLPITVEADVNIPPEERNIEDRFVALFLLVKILDMTNLKQCLQILSTFIRFLSFN